MRRSFFLLLLLPVLFGRPAFAQEVIPLTDKGGLHAAYVVPTDTFNRVDVQLIVLSGKYDDPDPSGTAHLTEHLAAFSADFTILKQARERDIHATTSNVATIYTNSGPPVDLETLLKLSRATLDTPDLPEGFAESEIDIVERETLLRERQSPLRWLRHIALKNLYGAPRGRVDNSVADLPKLSLEKAYQFHKEHYVASNVTLIVSGRVDPDLVATLVAEVFGDTEATPAPSKPWLAQRPSPKVAYVDRIETDRLQRDTIQFAKFVAFEGNPTSVDMQSTFFITTTILNERLFKALYHDQPGFLSVSQNWFFSKESDLELTLHAQLMPGFDLDRAHRRLKEAVARLLDDPITRPEIQNARQKQITWAENSARRPTSFRWFLSNVAADGFPPITPTGLIEILSETTDEEVREFAATAMQPSATSVVLAKKVE
ncbi:M16 family metallopeptidase [Cognatishimia sp.]|uniref:M16 family metallopeptidase n=1 Tax=Cognatishimia sp. TaxID=2211648 RepID=UPI003512C73C